MLSSQVLTPLTASPIAAGPVSLRRLDGIGQSANVAGAAF
jgi:hypothetical protein